ncbi:hypothetical protein QK342_14005 [Myroides odoratimimus]|uniref:hypothetical protein n=1 Tax=Myroides odoratimimus TaxID=76832 RepID=UPI00103958E1|nr:hypothetical protein [Myroides odoratimimus]QBK77381.1 hypothetical protein E0Z07_13945 [Myroides odoratimimus]WHT72815.1 hypothetical protein QK342_14005 [Myroides odoratimimus]WHU37399.1 hypothetical protein QNM93_14000 [Myroides odoratimimus]
MPKKNTFPTLYDEVLQLNITKLKEWEYLNPNQIQNGTISWNRNKDKIASISVTANTKNEQPFIELDYNYNDKPINYKINLVRVSSNLGKGFIWYFLCPRTNKRCRKMYLVNRYFAHREAFKNAMYETQTYSKLNREVIKKFSPYLKQDNLYSELYKKHFKKTYAGKPTKKYLRLMREIQKGESIPYEEIKKSYIRY